VINNHMKLYLETLRDNCGLAPNYPSTISSLRIAAGWLSAGLFTGDGWPGRWWGLRWLFRGNLSRTTSRLCCGGREPSLSFIRLTALGVESISGSSCSVRSSPLPLLSFLARRCPRVSGDSISDSSAKIALPLPLRPLVARVCGSWE